MKNQIKNTENVPFFSVLIPVFNGAQFIETCVNYILAQSFEDFELIICDDASTDNTFEILEQLAQKDSRIRILRHEKNQRAQITRNDLIRVAKGQYCIFCDADDYVLPAFFEIAAENLKKKHYDIIQYSFELDSDCASRERKMGMFKNQEFFGPDILKKYLTRTPYSFAPYAKTYAREMLLKALPRDKVLFSIDDIELTMRAAFYAQSYKSESRIVYHYRYGAGNCGSPNWSIDKIKAYITSSFAILNDTKRFFAENNVSDLYSSRFQHIIEDLCHSLLYNGAVSQKDVPETICFILQTFGQHEQDLFLLNKHTPLSLALKFNLKFLRIFLSRMFKKITGKKI